MRARTAAIFALGVVLLATMTATASSTSIRGSRFPRVHDFGHHRDDTLRGTADRDIICALAVTTPSGDVVATT